MPRSVFDIRLEFEIWIVFPAAFSSNRFRTRSNPASSSPRRKSGVPTLALQEPTWNESLEKEPDEPENE